MGPPSFFAAILFASLSIGCAPEKVSAPAPRGATAAEEAADVQPQKPLQKGAGVEVPLGNVASEEWGRLPFKISTVYENQAATNASPFHAGGGDWTFFDCQFGPNEPLEFTIGILNHGNDQTLSFGWGKAAISTSDRDTGARFVELFAKAFHTDSPRLRRSPLPLVPLTMNTAILGERLLRGSGGGFAGSGGDWTATKWFPQRNGLEAEIFFNYSLKSLEGEFTEKDPDYRKDLLAILAIGLRDGPRPERTPATDANLTDMGPRIEQVRLLLPQSSDHYSFTPAGKYVVYQNKTAILALDPAQPDHSREIATFDNPPLQVFPVDDNLHLLVCEGLPAKPGQISSDDPVRIWWVETDGQEKKLIIGPERGVDLGDPPVSPDHRFIAIEKWKDKAEGIDRYKVVSLVDRDKGTTQTIEIPNKSLSAIGWTGASDLLRVRLTTNRWTIDANQKSQSYLANPLTGAFEPVSTLAIDRADEAVSPDGKYSAQIDANKRLVVEDLTTHRTRTFTFNEDDLPYIGEDCVKWAGSRYLQFQAERLALIDITTMKMSYPVVADPPEASSSFLLSPDFRWVLRRSVGADGKSGLYLGRVVLP